MLYEAWLHLGNLLDIDCKAILPPFKIWTIECQGNVICACPHRKEIEMDKGFRIGIAFVNDLTFLRQIESILAALA